MRTHSADSRLSRYSIAVALTLVALLLRWWLLPSLGPSTPFVLLAITVSAWYGGLGPGLAATFLATSVIFLLPNLTGLAPGGIIPKTPLIFSILVMGVLISTLIESLHRARERAAKAASQLAVSNERFHLLVQSVTDYGIFMLNLDGTVASWNTGAEKITGYSAPEILGRPFARFYPTEDIANGKPEMELLLATETGRYEDEGWRLRKDGSLFWANVIVTAVRDQEGTLCGFSKVTRDMTERRQAEERNRLLIQEQAARIEAEAANKAKDEFLSVLSHELRTPLNSILGWVQLLREGHVEPEMVGDALSTIERNARTQTRLVEDLLDVSRMLSGKLSIQPQSTDLLPILESAVKTARVALGDRPAEIVVRTWPTPVVAMGDAVRLEQAIWNLLSNAIKFTSDGGCICIQLEKIGDQAEIVVSDNGAGINPEALPHVFDRFRQADSSLTRHHGGLGLGLAIVRYVVEAHGGSVDAASAGEGKGAVFILRIPLVEAVTPLAADSDGKPSAAGEAAAIGPHVNLAANALQGVKVLLVDDEEDNLQVCAAMLAQAGAVTRKAASAPEAIQVLDGWQPDVLISDIGMPDEDGYALMQQIRGGSGMSNGRPLPAIALTAYASSSDREKSIASGFQEHLTKPVEPAELIRAIGRTVAGSKAMVGSGDGAER